MLTTETLLAEIDRFLARSGMKDTTFSSHAVHNTRFLKRLRAGGQVQLDTVQAVMRFILLSEAEGYLRREAISEAALGELATADPDVVMKLRRGCIITPLLAESLLSFMCMPHSAVKAEWAVARGSDAVARAAE